MIEATYLTDDEARKRYLEGMEQYRLSLTKEEARKALIRIGVIKEG